MDRQTIVSSLRERQKELRQRGITSLSLFGSFARGEQRQDSDIDLLIGYEPNARLSLLDIVHIETELRKVFDTPVQVVSQAGLNPEFLRRIEPEQIHVF